MTRSAQLPPQTQVLTEDGRMRGEWYRYFEDLHSWSGLRGPNFDIWELDVGGHGVWEVGTTGTYSPQTGINLRAFDASSSEYVERAGALPNGYTPGTDIYPAVLWVPSDATTGTVKWQFEYSRIAKGGTIPALTAVDVTSSIIDTAESPAAKDKAHLSLFLESDGSSKVSGRTFRAGDSMIQVVTRLGGSDTYAAGVGLLWAGFVYQRSGHGTKERTP